MASSFGRVVAHKSGVSLAYSPCRVSVPCSSVALSTHRGPPTLLPTLASPYVVAAPSKSRPTRQSAAPPQAAASGSPELAMPDTELELAAQRVRQLEAEAIAMHDLAQRLNKEGRFEEAQTAYSSMHRLEDEASQLAARVGCVACVLGDPPGASPGGQQEQPSLCNLDPAVLLPYQRLHPVLPWARPQPASAGLLTPVAPEPLLPLIGAPPGVLEARALGCVVGSVLADAAAMGVHWVYDLAVLDEVEQERWQQAAAGLSAPLLSAPCSPSSTPSQTASRSSPPEHPRDFGLEFTEPPRSPFYSYASGRNSPYGEQTLVLLRSLAEGSGGGGTCDSASGGGGGGSGAGPTPGLDCGRYAALFAQSFGPESGFEGYRDVSTKGFLRNYGRGFPPPLSGANDAQANCVARLAPLVAAFGASLSPTSRGSTPPPPSSSASPSASSLSGSGPAADPLLGCVEWATRVTQNTDAAVAWASVGAVVLERLLLGLTAEAAVRHVIADLEAPAGGRLARHVGGMAPELAGHMARVLELRTTPVPAAVASLGRNCHMPNALQTPLHVVLHLEHAVGQQQRRRTKGAASGAGLGSVGAADGDALKDDPRVVALPAEAYVWGVRLAVREGGCCASRAAYVGACLGAMVAASGGAGGGEALGGLSEWLGRYPAAGQVRAWTEAILEGRRRATAA